MKNLSKIVIAVIVAMTLTLTSCHKGGEPAPANTSTGTGTGTGTGSQITFKDSTANINGGVVSSTGQTIDITKYIKNIGTATVTIANVSGDTSNIKVTYVGSSITILPRGVYCGTNVLTVVIDYSGGARMTSSSSGTLTANITVNTGSVAMINTYNIIKAYFGKTMNCDNGSLGNIKITQNGNITSTTSQSFYNNAYSTGGVYTITGNGISITPSNTSSSITYQVSPYTTNGYTLTYGTNIYDIF